MSRRSWKLILSIAVLAAAIGLLRWRLTADCRPQPGQWPSPAATVSAELSRIPEAFGPFRIFVDAGHGAEGNTGNLSCFCEHEQDFTLKIARHLGAALQSTGRFEARLSRGEQPVGYADRVRAAQDWRADAFLSIHSDVRGTAATWSPGPGRLCPRSDSGPGFAVLYSDEAEPALAGARALLAERVASQLQRAGFLPYDGAEYTGAYGAGRCAGVFADRHAMDKRIFVLRKTSMPAILIETHNALHTQESLRWSEEETLRAFDGAVINALVSVLSTSAGLAISP